MISIKIPFILLTVAIVNAEYISEDLRSFESEPSIGKTWFIDDSVEPRESQLSLNYKDDSGTKDLPINSGSDQSGVIKTIPRENKFSKKPVVPYYVKPFKFGAPYCKEVKKEENDKEIVTCYKCKDPKTGINYEHCTRASKTRSSRIRRSNPTAASDEGDDKDDYRLPEEYRFSEEYFLPQASKPASYKDKSDKCKRVVEDSMVCMVCQNARTHGKYKQCSYVHDPRDKAYEYSKSSSYANDKPAQGPKTHESIKQEDPESEEESWESPSSSHNYGVKHESQPKAAESNGCKKVHKDGQVCTVCKNPKTGGNSEKCYYEYQPSDKIYKFTRSKSFGFPYSSPYDKKDSDESVEESETKPKKSSVKKEDESPSSYKDFGYNSSFEDDDEYKSSESKSDYEYNPTASIYDSENEKIAEETKTSDCKQIKKDSMICSICKDPKTGGNSERCTYSYQPDDKLYSYSKKKSFGSPSQFKDRVDTASEEADKHSDGNTNSSDDSFNFSKVKVKNPKEKNTKNLTGFATEWEPKVKTYG